MTDFNTEPFFDDYSEDNKFYRVLFRPGYAVQARELTQMQTILQEQIRRHGDHIFKEGAMVIPGQVSYDLNVAYVKLVTNQTTNINQVLSELVGKEISNSAGLIAKVVTYTAAESIIITNPDNSTQAVLQENTLFLKYQNSIQDLIGNNVQQFSPNDYLSPVDGSVGLNVTVADETNDGIMPIGVGCTATIQRGIYYINKNFVLVTEQTVVLDKYSNEPSYRVGLKLSESVVYPEDDENLLDNALGSPNYAAPGAARYKIDLILTKVAENPDLVTSTQEVGFIDLLRLRAGKVIFKLDRTQYAEIEKTLARRTYDESGDYTLNPFRLQIKEYRNNFRGGWAASEKYIQGDLIKVNDGTIAGNNYFVCVKSGVSDSSAGGSSQFTTANTILYPSFTDGSVTWEYMLYPNFNQGVHSFTSGDVDFKDFTIDDHTILDATLAYGVEAGKAYVRGYEIEKLSTEFIPVPKSRDLPEGSAALATYFGVDSIPASTAAVSPLKTTNIDVSLGNYIIVDKALRAPNIITLSTVNLHSTVKSSASVTAAIIGTARIRAFERHETDSVDAGSFVVGETYTVTSLGNTSTAAWNATGVATGVTAAVGTTFVATTAGTGGTGTGKAKAYTYKVFLFDVEMKSGKSFDNVKSIYTTALSFSADLVLDSNSKAVLFDPNSSTLIYQLPDYAVKLVVGASYTVVRSYTQTASDGAIQLAPATGGYSFASTNDTSNYIVVNAAGAVIHPAIAVTNGSLYITGLANESHTIFATLGRTSSSPNSLRTVSDPDSPYQINTQATAQAKVIVLPHSYVTRIVSVKMAPQAWGSTSASYNTNITNRYIFDSGHSISQIGKSTLTLAAGAKAPSGPIEIKYEYLKPTETTAGDFLDTNSYTHVNSNMRYDQIPNISSYSLRDSIDFRPYFSDPVNNTYAQKYFPKYGTNISLSYYNYLGRMDNVSLSAEGRYTITQGTYSESGGLEPSTPNLSMQLARVSVEPYTFRRGDQNGTVVTPVENKRYTMRDIGKLERRIQDLEYYTALTLTELDTKNMRIVDSSGFDRMQNGFLVDSFDGQGVGDATSDDWNASIDSTKKELRPFFSQKQVNLLLNTSNLTPTEQARIIHGDLVTLAYDEVIMISQLKASKTESVNPFAVYSWKGMVQINPWSDTWFSTHHRPDIVLNDESQYNAIVAKANADNVLGTVWNAWQTVFSSTKSLASRMENLGGARGFSKADSQILTAANNGGSFWRDRNTFTIEELDFIGNTNHDVNSAQATAVAGSRVLTIETSATETKAARSGTRSFISDKVDSRVLEDRVVDTQVVPYIRPRAVLFTGYGFRPGTAMYAFFDNIIVNDYIQPAIKLKVAPRVKSTLGSTVTYYPHRFDVDRNCGTNVSAKERTVTYRNGDDISGTISVTTGSAIISGLATSFTTQVAVGDKINLGTGSLYTVLSITDNYTLTLTANYTGVAAEGVSCVVIPGDGRNTEEVEVAFNHGEVIKEIDGNGNTAIVVGQEIVGSDYYIYVLNIKGSGVFSTASAAYLQGEYSIASGDKPSVTFLSKEVPSALISSGTGLLCGVFNIPASPAMKFRTGTRELTFSDKSSSIPGVRSSTESTSGTAIYEAKGLIEIMQRTIVATRTANIVSEQVSGDNTIVTTSDRLTRDTGWFDPLAQTFIVQQEGGAFITSADIYFQQVDAKIPVRIEIREVVNGYPGSVVLPFSRVEKKASEVRISDNSNTATNFKFASPVFLQNGVEYALVVLSDSNSFRIWISETLGLDVSTTTPTTITSQPYSGVLFKSQNASTWTADQTQDMKFRINRAKFTSTPVNIQLTPTRLGYKNLGFNPLNFIVNSRKVRVVHNDHGMKTGDKVKLICRQITDSINGIPAASIFDRNHTIDAVELDAYVITLPSSTVTVTAGNFAIGVRYTIATVGTTIYTLIGSANNTVGTSFIATGAGSGTGTATNSGVSTAAGKTGGGYITASENFDFQTAMLEIAQIVPPGTTINYTASVLGEDGEILQYKISPKENFVFENNKIFPSEANYTSSSFPTLGFGVTATLTPSATTDSVSPVIDLSRIAMTMVSNKVDSPDLTINDEALDYFPITPVVNGVTTSVLIGIGGDITLEDNDDNGIYDTIVVDALTAPTLYDNLNNNLHTGDVIRLVYDGLTADLATRNMILIEKYQVDSQLKFTLKGWSGEVLEDGNASITWLSHFKSEYAPIGGSTHSKYVTKKINFNRPSEMLKIMFAAIIPTDAEVEIYYKTGMGISGDFIASSYSRATTNSYTKSSTDFSEITADIEGLAAFDSVMVKLVMKSINKAAVPRIQDFRVIAAAA